MNSQTEIQKVSTTQKLWVPERLKQPGTTTRTAAPKVKNQTDTKQIPSKVCFEGTLGAPKSFLTAINATAYTLECQFLWRNGMGAYSFKLPENSEFFKQSTKVTDNLSS